MSTIEWTDQTFNPLVGCSNLSAGCKNCYAATAAHSPRLQQFPQYQGITSDRGKWTGEVRFVPEVLGKILKLRKPQRIFMPSMSDPFHPNVQEEWLDQIFGTIALCPHLTFQVLTKRPGAMMEYMRSRKQRIRHAAVEIGRKHNLRTTEAFETCQFDWPLPNLLLGTTVEDQRAADERIPLLLKTPAIARFLSCEPLLEEIDLEFGRPRFFGDYPATLPSWVIVGGESGHGARECHIEWLRSVVQQCQTANVPVFVKQLGSKPVETIGGNVPNGGRFGEDVDWDEEVPIKLRDRKGGVLEEWPEDLQIRQFPQVAIAGGAQ